MGNLLVVIAVALFIAAIVVLVVAIRRPKTPATPGGRRDPLAFDAMPQFGPRQLEPAQLSATVASTMWSADQSPFARVPSCGGNTCWKAATRQPG